MYTVRDLKKFYKVAKTSRSFDSALERFTFNKNERYESNELDNLRLVISKHLELKNTKSIYGKASPHSKLARAKKLFYYFAYIQLQHTLPDIGKYLGCTHSAVSQGAKRIKGLLDVKDEEVVQDVKKIKQVLISKVL